MLVAVAAAAVADDSIAHVAVAAEGIALVDVAAEDIAHVAAAAEGIVPVAVAVAVADHSHRGPFDCHTFVEGTRMTYDLLE